MTATTDVLGLLEQALDQTADVLDGIAPGQEDQPTPCRSWNVATLADHVVYDLTRFAASARGEKVDWSTPAPPTGGDWGRAFRAQAPALLQTWRGAGDLDQTRTLGQAELPLSFLVNQQLAEFATHAWDVATATGQKVAWNDAGRRGRAGVGQDRATAGDARRRGERQDVRPGGRDPRRRAGLRPPGRLLRPHPAQLTRAIFAQRAHGTEVTALPSGSGRGSRIGPASARSSPVMCRTVAT